MRGINILAGLATILIFIGIYCFKAMSSRKIVKEEITYSKENKSTLIKLALFIAGSISIISGLVLLVKSFKLI